MTNEEKQKILEDALEQSYLLLKNAYTEEGDSKDLVTLLENIGTMEWMVDQFQIKDSVETCPVVERPETPAPAKQEPVTPAPAPAPVESQYSMTDVRAALAKARSKGVNVSDIIRAFGVDNFTALDASKYPAVMAKLAEEEAKKKEGN